MRNTQKTPGSAVHTALTCQVLTDCQSIRSLTRKVSDCQGTVRYEGGRESEKNWRWKSIKLAPSSPLNLRKPRLATRDTSGRTDDVRGVQSERHHAEKRAPMKLERKNSSDFLSYIILGNIWRNSINGPNQSGDQMFSMGRNQNKQSWAQLICMWRSRHQGAICLSLPAVNRTLRREADSENAVAIRVIMTYWMRVCITGTATGLIPFPFHFGLIRQKLWKSGGLLPPMSFKTINIQHSRVTDTSQIKSSESRGRFGGKNSTWLFFFL